MKTPIFLIAAAALITTGCFRFDGLAPGPAQSVQRIDRTLMLNPTHPHALLLQGRNQLNQQDFARAYRSFEAAKEAFPDLEEAWDGMGAALLRQRKSDQALAHYIAMEAVFPDSAAAAEGQALANFQLGALDEAGEQATRAIERDPGSSAALRVLGEIAYIEENYPEALRQWERAIALDPQLSGELSPLADDLRKFVAKYGANAP